MFIQLTSANEGKSFWLSYGAIEYIAQPQEATMIFMVDQKTYFTVVEDMEEVIDRIYTAELDLAQLKASAITEAGSWDILIEPDDDDEDEDEPPYNRIFRPSDN